MSKTVQTEFLEWMKNHDACFRTRSSAQGGSDSAGLYDLAYSSIAEPTDLLLRYVGEHLSDATRFKERLAETNAWGQATVRNQIASRYRLGAERILLTTGASDAIFLVCQAPRTCAGR